MKGHYIESGEVYELFPNLCILPQIGVGRETDNFDPNIDGYEASGTHTYTRPDGTQAVGVHWESLPKKEDQLAPDNLANFTDTLLTVRVERCRRECPLWSQHNYQGIDRKAPIVQTDERGNSVRIDYVARLNQPKGN